MADDGTFTLKNVSQQMEYRVRVGGLPQGAYVMSGRIGNVEAVNQPFVIAGGQPGSLQLRIGFNAGEVKGKVVDAAGDPRAGVFTTLVPDEGRRQRVELFFSTETNRTGHFDFGNVPPGRYKVFAWEDIPEGAYQDPDFIRRYDDRGKSVDVEGGGSANAELSPIP